MQHWEPGRILEPYEVFNLSVGRGTGGMIAILLGGLRMPLGEVIQFYKTVEEDVFEPQTQMDSIKDSLDGPVVLPTTATDQLKKKIKDLVQTKGLGTDLCEREDTLFGKVLASPVDHCPGEGNFFTYRTLRSYHGPSDHGIPDDHKPSID